MSTSRINLSSLHNPPSNPSLAYLLTFHTYGTWLHGRENGSVDRLHNVYDSPYLAPNPIRHVSEAKRLIASPVFLNPEARRVVQTTISEVAQNRGWNLLAFNIRTNHVHIVVAAAFHQPERVVADLKAWTTRRLRVAGLVTGSTGAWTRHASTRYLWNESHIKAAIDYTLNRQGNALDPQPSARSRERK